MVPASTVSPLPGRTAEGPLCLRCSVLDATHFLCSPCCHSEATGPPTCPHTTILTRWSRQDMFMKCRDMEGKSIVITLMKYTQIDLIVSCVNVQSRLFWTIPKKFYVKLVNKRYLNSCLVRQYLSIFSSSCLLSDLTLEVGGGRAIITLSKEDQYRESSCQSHTRN